MRAIMLLKLLLPYVAYLYTCSPENDVLITDN